MEKILWQLPVVLVALAAAAAIVALVVVVEFLLPLQPHGCRPSHGGAARILPALESYPAMDRGFETTRT